ncbi:hypothetical protein R3P38DRAFT_2925035 [Favolaschia claudopus]|uniref:Rhodopsin domain-containing protein n=1 Tax=Favolaschia claudopus TaxID=2862362 RepID=A0AAW0BWU6_9AGAR
MLNGKDPLVQLKITSATCSFVALGMTIFRLYKRRGRYWADDLWALFASLALIAQVVAVFLHVPLPNNLPKSTGVAVYYLMALTFYAVIWASRLSILFSIIRIDPSVARRKRLSWAAVAFLLAFIILTAQLLWVCEPKQEWKKAPNPQCPLPLQVAVLQLVTDILADGLLLLAPVPLFRNLINKAFRQKLTLIFSTCVVTTIVSLVHAAFILQKGGIKVVISALVEDCFSLIVANIPVVVTTMVDIVGDADQVRTNRTTPFSGMFWWSDISTTVPGVFSEGSILALRTPTQSSAQHHPDEIELSYPKLPQDSDPWLSSDLPKDGRTIVNDRRGFPYPTSPL